MANLDQVTTQIRFGLEQLAARNAHHDFEHLCRHLTRARICSNVLPATGPVSAGGDQGRDFETFRTYLHSTPLSDSVFVGLVSRRRIVFACSLEKKIAPKIKSDIKTIMAPGSAIEAIHYFCTADVPVAARHRLQAWTKSDYSIELEIHDGQAIAELLTHREVFWIAERYLQIPGEIFPRSEIDDGEGWYKEFLNRCREVEPPYNHANFSDIRLAARNALSKDEIKQDLPFWIDLLKPYRDVELPGNLRRRATYEVSVLSLRGLGTLEGYEDSIRLYYSAIARLEESADLEDAAVLLNFCVYASSQHRCQLDFDELRGWWTRLKDRVDELLAAVTAPNRRAALLDTRGYLCFSVLAPKERTQQIREGLAWWMKLLTVVQNAPLFPLEDFADRLTKFIHFLSDVPAYQKLTERVDRLLSKRVGSFIAAEKCRDRALALYEKGKLLPAIDQLHKTKINWFAAETLSHSMVTMLFIAQCYQQLGLHLAAKYYALGVASIALHSQDNDLKPFIPRALLIAAQHDYGEGAWCSFLELTNIGLLNHLHFAEDAREISSHSYLQRTIWCVAMMKSITERLAPHHLPLLDKATEQWGLADFINEILQDTREVWMSKPVADVWSMIENSLGNVPFSDAGELREVAWSELGITWRVQWTNNYDTTPSAEGFVAVLQIFLADLANIDFCLMKTEVTIKITSSDDAQVVVEDTSSKDHRSWNVSLPVIKSNERDDIQHSRHDFFLVAGTILADLALVPDKTLDKRMEECFSKGVMSKLFVAQPYEMLYREFIRRSQFEKTDRFSQVKPQPPQPFKVKEFEETAWFSGPGPGYSKTAANRWIKNRYKYCMLPIEQTWERLKRDTNFLTVVARLRADGWLDWHILSAVQGITLNYRTMQHPEARASFEFMTARFKQLMQEPEEATTELVPLSLFSEKALREQLRVNMLSFLDVIGLTCRQRFPDMDAIEHFLKHRYNYWSDDIEHNSIFEPGVG